MTGPAHPRSSADTEPYWQAAREGKLLFQRCRACAEPVFHPRPACPYCLSDDLAWERSAGEGSVYSFTVQHVPLNQADTAFRPRRLGIVALDEGFHMFSEIVDAEGARVRIGSRVRVWFDDRGGGVSLPKFQVQR